MIRSPPEAQGREEFAANRRRLHSKYRYIERFIGIEQSFRVELEGNSSRKTSVPFLMKEICASTPRRSKIQKHVPVGKQN
ncbi:hypothetical protein [Sphingomonas sp. BAUL-RG-20F-R05-02]|uniref:hypothetical protein n=1 Tax=Sphingomonas sp. BAUL-RG-20F-R05-02 TaxID=2914830 RepID=UPI001F582EED|nr:hypothetical protein [Sphingomonas sp. BAUL-RG-20F-R05-02]